MENIPKKWTLLYVDDDEDFLSLIRHILKFRPEIRLLTSKEAVHGLELAREYRPDLIILDINQPRMDGYAVLKNLQGHESTCHIPVIACSAYAKREDIIKGLAAGFRRYLVKPMKISDFLESIDEILERKK